MNVVLYCPEIPQNVGSIIRTCACFGAKLHIIDPIGFVWDEKRIKRCAMDYTSQVEILRYKSFEYFSESFKKNNQKNNQIYCNSEISFNEFPRLIAIDVKGPLLYNNFSYRNNDFLLFGKESDGLPDNILQLCDSSLRISMQENCRSLNLAVSVGIILSRTFVGIS